MKIRPDEVEKYLDEDPDVYLKDYLKRKKRQYDTIYKKQRQKEEKIHL